VSAEGVRVVAHLAPGMRLDDGRILETVAPRGMTVGEILGRDDLPVVVYCDGRVLEEHEHATAVPSELVTIKRVPRGEQIGRILGTIAVIVLAAYTGGAIFSWATSAAVGYSTATGAALAAGAAAAVSVVGTLALNALIPPAVPEPGGGGAGVDQLAAITGVRNQVAPFRPIPRLYGRCKYYPPIPMTALPFTELVGRDQYLRIMVCLGYGPLDIGGTIVGEGKALLTEADLPLTGDPIKIGDTAIDSFEDVEFEIGAPTDLSLFTKQIVEQAVGVNLNEQGTPTANEQTLTDGNSVTRTTEPDTDEFSVELFSPALFTFTADGDTVWASVDFRVEYSPAGADTWTTAISTWRISNRERSAVREGRRIVLPSAGQYDVRLTRLQTYYQRIASTATDFQWTVLRSIKRDAVPFDVPGTVCMAMRIRATDQLSGPLDRLSVEAMAVLQAWNGSAWVEQATRNPAWAYADIITGNANRSPIDRSLIDTTALAAWATQCDSEGFHFDIVYDAEGTPFDRLREAAAAGLGSWLVNDAAEVSVVREPGSAQTPVMLVSPRNASGFELSRAFRKRPHALRVEFYDTAADEVAERIVYDDGYDATNATRFEQLPTIGIRDPDHAWKLGRYFLAALRLRAESYRWRMDLQHLVFQRGDTVLLADDSIKVGLAWARVREVTTDGGGDVTHIRVDEDLVMEGGTSYAVRAQRVASGAIATHALVTEAGAQRTVELATPSSNIAVGDHLLFGEAGAESIPVRIARINPIGDFLADVVALPEAPDILDAFTGTIPAWDPVITEPVDPSLLPPTKPSILEVSSGLLAGAGGAGRIQEAVVLIDFEMPPGLIGTYVEGRFRRRETPAGAAGELSTKWRTFGSVTPSERGFLTLHDGVEPGQVVDLQVRSLRNGRASAWSATTTHTVGSGQLNLNAVNVDGLSAGQNLLSRASVVEQSWSGRFGPTYAFTLEQLGLEVGDVVSLGMDLKSATGADVTIATIQFREADNTLVDTFSEAAPASSSFVRAAEEGVTIPALTARVLVYPVNDDETETATVRRMMLNRGPVALPYEEPPARGNRGELILDTSEDTVATGSKAYASGTQPAIETTGLNASATMTPDVDSRVYVAWGAQAQISNTTSGTAIGEALLEAVVLIDGVVEHTEALVLEGFTTAQSLWGTLAGGLSFDVPAGDEIEVRLRVYRDFDTAGSTPAQTIYYREAACSLVRVQT
jgi:hypothetical protein